jgi:type IV pilus assembly protein PilE
MINTHKKGFTLIELMIVVAIVAILVALALPSFRDVIRKSRRADAMNAIINIQLAQERWRVNNSTYGTLVNLGINAASPEGHYTMSVTGNTFSNYTIVATAAGGQASDKCGNFTLTNTAGVIAKTVSGSEAATRCWTK